MQYHFHEFYVILLFKISVSMFMSKTANVFISALHRSDAMMPCSHHIQLDATYF